jgi:hypothetical protein
MKKAILKIEKFLLFFSLGASFFYGGKDLNPPKKKDYLGRIILSLLGLIIFLFIVGVLFFLIMSIVA